MSKYKNDILHFNYWKPNQKHPMEYACKYDEMKDVITQLEQGIKNATIVDYEMYGFANFNDPARNIIRGDTLYIREKRGVQKTLDIA